MCLIQNYLVSFLLFSIGIQLSQCKLVAEEELLFDTFPENFLWGVASSAYQIEGGLERVNRVVKC